MYNCVIDFLLNEAVSGSKLYVVVATHNEAGVRHAVEGLLNKHISIQDGRFVFGQIYGMGEQMSMPLGMKKQQIIIRFVYSQTYLEIYSKLWFYCLQICALWSSFRSSAIFVQVC
jgi:hypothetical protein